MSNPAFFIDGFAEKLIIQKLCPNKIVRRIDLNGKDAKISAIADKISSLIRLLNNRNWPIVILIDREDRKETREQIKDELEKELKKRKIKENIIIGVADRMLENWILADWQSFKTNTHTGVRRPKVNEGRNGKSIIKHCIKMYQETTDGVRLFVKANSKTIVERSPSFKEFADQLKGLKCKWLEQ